jgi:nitrous oxidase accessory protein
MIPSSPTLRSAGLAVALAAAAGACSGPGAGGPAIDRVGGVVDRPDGCREVAAGADLAAAIRDAAPGDALCLAPGRYRGPLVLDRPLTLWGPRAAIIESSGNGTTVLVQGQDIALLGFQIDGSGGRFDLLDSALRVEGDDVQVEGVLIVNATFGILVEKSNRVVVRGNVVVGDGAKALGLRGDGIRLWETRDSIVENNLVRHSRDMVVWYSPRNRIANNRIEGSRYGTHFMYSSDNTVEDNRYLDNVVGVFVMYSRDITIRRNVMTGAAGAAGMGIGLKESGNIRATGNVMVDDTIGLYLDTSPLQLTDANHFEGNVFWACRDGVIFHSSAERNSFTDNAFGDNGRQVVVEGGGDALGVAWTGNYFDDYAGYDLDGDGAGDVPYTLRSLSADLTSNNPHVQFFRRTPAMAMADAAGKMVPLLTPRTILRDPRPRLSLPPLDLPALDQELSP